MTKEHPNIKLLSKLNIRDLDASAVLFSNDFVFHYFNPHLPNIEGDYVGLEEFKRFFEIIARETNGTFTIEPMTATPIGEELLIIHTHNTMISKGNTLTMNVVVVWRIVDGEVTEAWVSHRH